MGSFTVQKVQRTLTVQRGAPAILRVTTKTTNTVTVKASGLRGPRGEKGDPGESIRGESGPRGEPGIGIKGDKGDPSIMAARTLAASGDVAWSISFDGSSNVESIATLSNVNTTPGQIGSVTSVPILTIDAKGRITAVSSATLGNAAARNIGATGATVPLLNGTNYWSAPQTFGSKLNTVSSGGNSAGFNIAQGARPTTPANGDLWATYEGLYAYLNGNNRSVVFAEKATTFVAKLTFQPSKAASASIAIPVGVKPTTPAAGDVWATNSGLFWNNGTTGRQVVFTDSPELTIATTTARDRRRVTGLGDSRMAAIYNDLVAQIYGNRSPLNVANSLMGSRLIIEDSFGKSGDRTDHLYARLDAAIATNAGILYLQGGVNNIAAVATNGNYTYVHAVTGETVTISTVAAVTARDLIDISNRAKSAGMIVVIEQEVGAQGLNTAEKLTALMDLRVALYNYARSTTNVVLHDAIGIVMQASGLTFKVGYAYDATHVNARGAYYWGKSLAQTLERIVPPSATILVGNGLEVLANGRRQLLANPIFAIATGGTLGTGASGTVPSGWVAHIASGGSLTSGIIADAGGIGNNVTLDITYTAANAVARLDQSLSGWSNGAYNSAIIAGDVVEAVAKVEIIGNPDVLAGAYLYLSVNTGSGGISSDSMTLYGIGDANNLGPNEPATYILKTRRFTIPAGVGAYPFVTASTRFVSSGSGSVSVKVHQIALRRVG